MRPIEKLENMLESKNIWFERLTNNDKSAYFIVTGGICLNLIEKYFPRAAGAWDEALPSWVREFAAEHYARWIREFAAEHNDLLPPLHYYCIWWKKCLK
jgi:hypothetical protein